MGLRERRRQAVRVDLERAAVRLAAEHGYHAVTTEQVAAAAGVSHRTLFRHVGTKEELVLGSLLRGGRAIIHHLEERPASEPVHLALQQAVLARIDAFDVDEDGVRAWRTAMLGAPDLLDRLTLIGAEDRARLVELVAERMGDGADDAELLVALLLTAAQQAFARWLRSGDDAPSLRAETERAFGFLGSWPWRTDGTVE
jgi:AcrR family transcriptional regulator